MPTDMCACKSHIVLLSRISLTFDNNIITLVNCDVAISVRPILLMKPTKGVNYLMHNSSFESTALASAICIHYRDFLHTSIAILPYHGPSKIHTVISSTCSFHCTTLHCNRVHGYLSPVPLPPPPLPHAPPFSVVPADMYSFKGLNVVITLHIWKWFKLGL